VFDNTGESWSRTYSAADPTKPIRIMLAWTDAPGHGLGGSTPAWNNDLDLRVTADGNTFLGNVLDNAGWSTTGGSADAKNNTEAVFLQSAQHAGSVTVEVLASDINSDALPHGGDATDQDFALVCYNCADDSAPTGIDLDLAASTTSIQVLPGDPIRYSVLVTNAGPGTAHDIDVAVDLPDAATATLADGADWSCVDFGTASRYCHFAGSLALGASSGFCIDAVVSANPSDPVTATFSAQAEEADADETNNASIVTTPLLDRIFDDGFEAVAR
jgi:uncharacterized repeat protein (TIGR01451 family)